jgi:hypothetical protein
MALRLSLLLVTLVATTASAQGVLREGRFDDSYRIGDEWGKRPVTQQDQERSPQLARIAQATARVGGATGFYLGKFAGHHVVATNHHVCPRSSSCLNSTIRFPLLNMSFRVTKLFGTWTDIDLALLSINVPDARQESRLADVAGSFAFDLPLAPGQELITVGFGAGNNPGRALVANQDSDCKVFSQTGDFRFMADPDEVNPGPYRAWSFANGCDVSHGDSGSAMVDRASGRVIGIIWTGKVPKNERVQRSSYLEEILGMSDGDVWTELSYAVPASKIGDYLERFAADPSYPADGRAVFEALAGER